MTATSPAGALEEAEVEALVTDRYLDALLAAADRRAVDTPSDAALDPCLRVAALRLRDELVRVHPSFRFQERVARTLADAADAMRRPAPGGWGAEPTRARLLGLPVIADGHRGPLLASEFEPSPGEGSTDQPRAGFSRPILLSGVVTSAALSLAGAAFVAWRFSRGATDDPMARALRAARAVRGALPRGLA